MTFRLARITLREITLPLVEPFRTARGVVEERRILLAQLADGEGHEAWSECVAESSPTYSPDTVDDCWLALTQWIIPALLGHAVEDAAAVDTLLEREIRGHNMARATVEMGMWTLESLRAGVSLSTLLARHAGAVPRSHVVAGLAVGFQNSPALLAERIGAARAHGYARIRVKIEPGRDVEWLRAARAALGPGVALAADANCAYSLDDPAHLAALQEIDGLGLAMLEQPLAHDDFVRHAELQRRMSTPLCLDESIRDAASVATMLALGSGRMVNVKPGRIGGFRESLRVHALCVGGAVPLWCGGMLESGIGRACNVALAALPGFTEPGDLSPSARYWQRDVVIPAWTMDDAGRVRVPLDRPGIGVDVDTSFVDALTVRAVTFQAR